MQSKTRVSKSHVSDTQSIDLLQTLYGQGVPNWFCTNGPRGQDSWLNSHESPARTIGQTYEERLIGERLFGVLVEQC
jgi:hypothetical protein